MDLLEKFGINGMLLLSQVINFVIVLAVLYFVAYKPILRLLHERQEKIDTSLKNAEKIQHDLEALEQEKEKILSQTRKKADHILTDAQHKTNEHVERLLTEARAKTARMLEKAEHDIGQQKHQLILAAQKDLGNIMILALEKILREKMNNSTDLKKIEQTLEEIIQNNARS